MKPRILLPVKGLIAFFLIAASWSQSAELPVSEPIIEEIDLIHFSHTDVGFTDSPSLCRELYRRYLDIAVDTVLDTARGLADRRFFWTAEATLPVADWWQAASASRRAQFLKAVRTGQLEVSALACNNTPFMNAAQWRTMVHWLPEDLWAKVHPTVAIQDDVNGFPRAGAMALLDRGVHWLVTGINEDSGGSPFPRPSAFWWKMPDGRKMFVWLSTGYGAGFGLFEAGEWRRGPVPAAADTLYRPPRAGDMLMCDESSLRAAQRQCLERIRSMEKAGYKHRVLTMSITSQWRYDNDPPFPPLAEFVAAWNRLGLKPRLRLCSAAEAMDRMEREMGPTAPEYSGEWTDWWANGTASAPREVAASRLAKRRLEAVQSPLWGPVTLALEKKLAEQYQDLCLFDEHTWGSSLSVAKPYSLDTQDQFAEKSLLAYRPMAHAEWLLSQRARTKLVSAGEGLFVANTAQAPFSGWVRMIATCLRENPKSLEDPQTGKHLPLYFEPGMQPWGRPNQSEDLSREDISATFPDQAANQVAKIWVEKLPAQTIQRLRWSTQPADKETENPAPDIKMDAMGWPTSVVWPGMKGTLFLEGFGDFTSIQVNAFPPRHTLADIRGLQGEARDKKRAEVLAEVPGVEDGKAIVQSNSHTIVYTQAIRHPRLQWATRVLEVWKNEPRARLTLRINRLSSAAPEIFYLAFPLPTGEVLPRMSSGGQLFTPFTDQLSGTCRDYFALDGWAEYTTPQGRWIWVSRDAPLVSFGVSPTLSARQTPPKECHRLLSMLFNNFWYTNFVADEHGIMEFQYDLVWRENREVTASDVASVLTSEPVALINPALPEDARVIRDLYQP